MTNIIPLQSMQADQSMNSLQIADLLNTRHDSVKRTIERLIDQEAIAQPPMVDMQEIKGNSRQYTTQTYVFSGEQGKLDSITVVAQLCPHYTAKIVKRWMQLEHLVSSSDYQQIIEQNQTLKAHILKQNPEYQTIKVMHNGGLQNSQIQLATNLAKSTVEKRLRTMRGLGLIGNKRQMKVSKPVEAFQLEMGV